VPLLFGVLGLKFSQFHLRRIANRRFYEEGIPLGEC